MIRLKECFMKRDNKYTQVYRNDDMALYLVDNEHGCYVEVFKIRMHKADKYHNDDMALYLVDNEHGCYYEVFRIRMHKADKYHNDEYERYPGDESFGDWAWCCSNRKSLEKIMNREFPNVPIPNILMNR